MTSSYPQPPVKKKKTGLKIALIVAAVVAVCGCGGAIATIVGIGGKSDNGSTAAPAAKGGKSTTKAKLGQPVRDGKFEFTVTKVTYGQDTVGDQYLNKKAQGQFALVEVSVKNVGNDARMLDGSSQRAFGPNGVKYEHDGVAETYANKGTATFLNTINPGNAVAGLIVFDIPAGTKLTAIELHDSAFSGGASVDLT